MKTLKELNNVERAKLLAQLFLKELPEMVEAIDTYTKSVIEKQDELKKTWDMGLLTADYWIRLAETTQKTIKTNAKGINTKPAWFADQLFDGMLSLTSAQALLQFAQDESNECKRMINLLFNPKE